MEIIDYVIENYEKLPKSNFSGQECVIVEERENSNYGYGHHSYEGIGITKEGNVVWCYSSGCSCNGSAGMDHRQDKTAKILVVEGVDISQLKPAEIDFKNLEVSFEDY